MTPGTSGGPPSDAVVLFDGKNMDAWKGGEKWVIEDGAAIASSVASTKQAFGDCQLHVEFATPKEVSGKGQGRGNNGIGFMDARYEVQVLDSYGLEMYLPMDKRNATAAELLGRGHVERLMISQDYCASIDWFPPEAAEMFEASGGIRNWSMTLVFDEVVPALREMGALDDDGYETIFKENPKRWLTA